MDYLNRELAIGKINEFARRRKPFVFVIDFSATRAIVLAPAEAAERGIRYSFGSDSLTGEVLLSRESFTFEPEPVSFEEYNKAFTRITNHLRQGDTYLLNLTFPTKIRTNLSLEAIYSISHAPYKLFFGGRFVVFSPEIFIRIRDGKIFSYPMKGTIDAAIPDAEKCILGDEKESFEHNTIVDLIRNDLSMVSTGVKVDRFRYIDRIRTNRQELLQVSSEISGNLPADYHERLGEIIFTLLPAGSVTGAPKRRTVEIIGETEPSERGFYTGIFGFFDGNNLDSAVMIRFIEELNGELIFRSGGGITALSEAQKEYEELIQKVYVPVI
jgi:para-aminobenzoate synthetase component 1